MAPVWAAGAQVHTTSDTVPLDAEGRVVVDNHEGQISIDTWDREEVRYEAVVEAESGAEYPEATTVRIEHDEHLVRLRTEYDESKGTSGGLFGGSRSQNLMPVRYTVTMPRTARLEIDDHESDIDIRDLQAQVTIDTHEGPVSLSNHNGLANIDTHEGSVTVEGQTGPLNVESHDGPIEITNLTGDLTIDTHDSRIRVNSVTGSTTIDTHEADVRAEHLHGGLRMDTHDGRGRFAFNELRGDIEIDTHGGTFTLVLPADAGFNLRTDLHSGEVTGDFDLSAYRTSENEPDYLGQIGGGGPLLSLKAHDASFEIRTQ